MPLESATYISELDPTWPLGTDNVSQGDDHLRMIKQVLQNTFPDQDGPLATGYTGEIRMYAGDTPPSGFLLCDGVAISRATYADLFAVIGETYGAGDGSTTFNKPDLRDRVAAGSSATNALAAKQGKDTWVSADLPAHTHTVVANGNHNHGYSFDTNNVDAGGANTFVKDMHNGTEGNWNRVTTTAGSHTHTVNSTGSGGDNRQATLYLNYMIKT